MTDEEKIHELYIRYNSHSSLFDDQGTLLHSELLGHPNYNAVRFINPRDKFLLHKGTANGRDETEFENICSLGFPLMCLCYARSGRDDAYYSAATMRQMCKHCKNYIPDRQPDKSYDPNADKNNMSIFLPYFITKIYGSTIWYDPTEETKPSAYVYFVSDGEFVKIGIAKDPEKRLCGIQTGNARICSILFLIPFKTSDDAQKAEYDLHWIYAAYRKCGEWFDILSKLDISRFKNEFWETQI